MSTYGAPTLDYTITMILTAFTIFHVILSLIGIATGLSVLYGFLTSKRSAVTTLFLCGRQ